MLSQGRRIAASICALALSLSLSAPAFAAAEPQSMMTVVAAPATQTATPVKATVTQEEAIKIALSKFAIPADLGNPRVNLWENSGNTQPIWNLSWEKDPRLGGTMIRYNVNVNARTGEITNYGFYRQDPNGEPLAKYSREEALPIAQEYFAKLVPADKASQFKLEDLNRYDNLAFLWTRQVNGYPYINDTVMIKVDGVDGCLREFGFSWDDQSQFPAPDKVVDAGRAQAQYDAKVGPQLFYQQFYSPSGRNPVQLVYRNRLDGAVVDAFTGELTTVPGKPWPDEGKPIALGPSTATLTKLEEPMTKEHALELARHFLGQDAAGNPDNSSYADASQVAGRDNGSSVATWNFNWSIGNKEPGESKWLSATVDVTHGVMVAYTSDGPYLADDKVKDLTPVAEEAARLAAIAALKVVRPDLLGQVELLDRSVIELYDYMPAGMPKPIQREYNFNFTRLVNGIPFSENSVYISVDRFSGAVKRFSAYWADRVFPDPQGVKITAPEALKVFTGEQPLRAVYLAVHDGYGPDAMQTVRLVYQPYNPWGGNFVDAVNGHFVDYSYNDITQLRQGASDIANEPAKQEIQALLAAGAFSLTDGKFNPVGTMTRGELAKALVIAFSQARRYMLTDSAMMMSGGAPTPSYTDVNYDNGYFGYVEAAVKAGILIPRSADEKLNPDELVTHEELALLTARAMGYGPITNLKTTISNAYTDGDKIAVECRNAVGLLAGLEILPNTGELRPQAQVTRADVAKLLANAVQKAQNNRYYW